MQYIIERAKVRPSLDAGWDSPGWKDAQVLEVSNFHPRSTEHRPRTRAKLLYDDTGVYVKFLVDDQHVRAARVGYQVDVCRDSCVEWFAQPDQGQVPGAYLNFEMNCGGALLLFYIEDPTPAPAGGFTKYTHVPKELLDTINIWHSLPRRVDPAIDQPVQWSVAYHVPWSLFEHYFGKMDSMTGRTWRSNFFKCGDDLPKPHWAAWAPIGEVLRFHQPQYFGQTRFA